MVTDRGHANGDRATLTVYCDRGHEDRPLLWEFERIAAELGNWEWVELGGVGSRAEDETYRFACDRCGLVAVGRADVVQPEFDRLASHGIRRITLDRLRAVLRAIE